MGVFATKSLDNDSPYTKHFVNDGTGRVLYIGHTEPGTLTSAAKWKIQKFSYDSNGAVTDIQWSGGTTNFDKVMDNYASYVYS